MILCSVLANPKPPALSCKINGRLFHDGESAEVLQQSVDKSSIICQQCKCDAGKHKCHKIFDCDIQELGCEKSVKITGQCCPVCGTYPLHIIHINFVKWWWDWTLIKIMLELHQEINISITSFKPVTTMERNCHQATNGRKFLEKTAWYARVSRVVLHTVQGSLEAVNQVGT